MRGHELRGKRVGLVGLGRIGRRMARYCEAFDAFVGYCDPYVSDSRYRSSSLEEIFDESDAVCICCRLTDETKGMIDQKLLLRLKNGAVLVNTSRGEVVVETALLEALRIRPDLKVALDVLDGEVTQSHTRSPLLELHNRGQIMITPHIAGATVESQMKAATIALGLLRRHLATSHSMSRS